MQARTKILLAPVFVFIFFIVLIVALAPTAASTYLGQRSVVRLLNRKLGGKAEMQKISLSWFGNQKLGDVAIRDQNRNVVLHFDQVIIEQNLASLLWHHIWQAKGTFSGLSLHYPFWLAKEGQGTFDFDGPGNLKAEFEGCFLDEQPFHMRLQGSLAESLGSPDTLCLQLDSPAGHMAGRFTVGDFIQLDHHDKQPISFNWKVDPRLVNAWKLSLPTRQTNTLELLEPFQLNGKLKEFKWPLNSADLTQAALAVEMEADQLRLRNSQLEHNMDFKEVQLSLNKNEQSAFFKFALRAHGGDTSYTNHLNIQGTTDNLDTLQLKASGAKLPTQTIATLLPMMDEKAPEQLAAVFGNKINFDLTFFLKHMDGPLQVSLNGELGSFFMDGFISNQVLQLKSPLKLITTASEQLGREIAQPFTPIFGGLKSADNPLELTIEPDGFALPLKDIQIDHMAADKIKVDLGILHFYNQGELAKMLRPYRLKTDQLITLWCTPLYLSIQRGNATLQRMDVLINHLYPIAAWGEIDLSQATLNMHLGLSTAALNQALNISAPMPDSLTVLPLKGRQGKLSIDTSELKLQIGATLAQFLGPAGTQLQDTTTLSHPHIPAATTNPLPWESGPQSAAEETTNKKKRKARKHSLAALARKGRFLLKMLQE